MIAYNGKAVDRCLHTDTDHKPNVFLTQSWNLCVSATRVHSHPVIPIERVRDRRMSACEQMDARFEKYNTTFHATRAFVRETWLEEHFHAMETCNADSDEVSVWELKGLRLVGIRCRLELCVVNRAKAAQFLFDLTSSLPLCGASERDPLLSMFFIKYSVRSQLGQRRMA